MKVMGLPMDWLSLGIHLLQSLFFFTLIVNSSLDWSGSFYIVTEFLRAENAEIHVGFNPIWLLRAL